MKSKNTSQIGLIRINTLTTFMASTCNHGNLFPKKSLKRLLQPKTKLFKILFIFAEIGKIPPTACHLEKRMGDAVDWRPRRSSAQFLSI